MVESVPQPPNTLGNVSQLISQLAPIFLGSGKATSTTNASPGAIASNQQIMQQALANSNNPDATNAIVQNIMNKAAVNFAPVIGQQNAAGMYNSSTLSMLSAQASGEATAQSAQAVLNYQTQQQQIAAAASAAGLNASKTTVSQTAPAVDPTLSILSAVGSLGLNGLKTFFPETTKSIEQSAISGVKSVGNSILDTGKSVVNSITGNTGVDGADAVIAPSNSAGELGTKVASDVSDFASDAGGGGSGQVLDAGSAVSSVANSAGSSVSSDAASGGILDAASLAGDDAAIDTTGAILGDAGAATAADIASFGGTAADFGADAASSIAGEAAGETASSIAGDVAGGVAGGVAGLAGGISAVGGAIHLAGSLIGGDAGTGIQAVGDLLSPINGIADVGAAIGDAVGGTAGEAIDVATDPIGSAASAVSLICTVMKEDGYMSEMAYKKSSAKFRNYTRASQKSYWLWARPAARYMRNNPDSYFSYLLRCLFAARTNAITGDKSWKSLLARIFVATFTTVLGVVTLQWIDFPGNKMQRGLN